MIFLEKIPLISICIPNYNYASYLIECLESVLNQTYRDFEVIFRDNASTDCSFEIAQLYRDKFLKQGIPFKIGKIRRIWEVIEILNYAQWKAVENID